MKMEARPEVWWSKLIIMTAFQYLLGNWLPFNPDIVLTTLTLIGDHLRRL